MGDGRVKDRQLILAASTPLPDIWAWNKDTELLRTIQYHTVKCTEARSLVQDACP